VIDRPPIYHFLLVVCSNKNSTLHRFLNTTNFTVYMTDGVLMKEVLQFRKDSRNYKPRVLSDSCANIIVINTCHIFRGVSVLKF